jgi:hypothetical protein
VVRNILEEYAASISMYKQLCNLSILIISSAFLDDEYLGGNLITSVRDGMKMHLNIPVRLLGKLKYKHSCLTEISPKAIN